MSPRLRRLAPVLAGWLAVCVPLAAAEDAAPCSEEATSVAVPAGASLAPAFERILEGRPLPTAFDLDPGGEAGTGPGDETTPPEPSASRRSG
jgi:hypothetical protein